MVDDFSSMRTSAPSNFAIWTLPTRRNVFLSVDEARPPPVCLCRMMRASRLSLCATAATWIVWLLWMAPSVTRVVTLVLSWPWLCSLFVGLRISGIMYSSFRYLFPAQASGDEWSSRLA